MNDSGRGHYTGSTALLSNRTNIHGQFEKFMRACRSGQISIMNEIYEDDKRILQSRAAFGSTAIHIAAENGKITTLEWLRERGGDFSAKTRPRNQTPMHFAAARGQVQTLKWLCENTQALGCDIDAKDYRKRTATELATQYGFHEAAKCLENAKRIPLQSKLHRTQFGATFGDNKITTWESYSRDQLIEGLSDLRQLHEEELKSRKEVEEKQFIEISSLKSDLSDVRLQVSELKSLVEHLAKKDRDDIHSETNAKLLEESERSKYLNGLTIGTVRVETAHLSASTSEWKNDDEEEENEDENGEGKQPETNEGKKENGEDEEKDVVLEEEEGKRIETVNKEEQEEEVVPAEPEEKIIEPEPEVEIKPDTEDGISSRPSTTQSVKEAEGWGAGLDENEIEEDGAWSSKK